MMKESSCLLVQANVGCLFNLCRLANNNSVDKIGEPSLVINTRRMNLKSSNSYRCIKREMNHNNDRSRRQEQISECKAKEMKSSPRLIQLSSSSSSSSLFSLSSSSRLKHKRHRERRFIEAVPIISLPIFCYLSSLLAIWFLILNCICRMPAMVESARLPDIYWNSSNPIFRIDNTDHIFDVNKKQHDHDQVDLVCPSSPSSSSLSTSTTNGDPAGNNNLPNETSSQERYIIYSVSKEEYDTCRLNSNQARVVAVCDQQANGKNRPPFTVTFRSFTPQPNGLEFKAGQDYYFISALIGYQNDPHKRFSPCREQNMKVIFKVCCKSSSPSPSSSSLLSPNGGTGTNLAPPQVPSNNRPTQASLLPPNNQLRPATPASTRRPPVITLRPSLGPFHQHQQLQPAAPKTSMLDDYLKTLTPSFNQANQQQQPITVLPIEVLQSSEPPSQVSSTTSTTTSTTTQAPDVGNEISPNDQPPSTSYPSAPQFRLPPMRPENGRNPSPFFPFDPTAPPDMIQKYKPTPLPPNLTHPKYPSMALSTAHSTHLRPTSQPSRQIEPAPWHLPDNRGNHMHRPAFPGQAHRDNSRISFYPPSMWPQYEQPAPTRDSISVLDQQQQPVSSASLRVSSLTALVPCLLALALLALYLNHRTKRAQLASIR